MRIAIASGKGGTGKTTIAVSLAKSLEKRGHRSQRDRRPPMLLDCDVEAPDAHLFLNPTIDRSVPASIQVPAIDPERCSSCGDCAEACQFNALAVLGDEVLLLPDLCHGCGSCTLICRFRAISEAPREIGTLERGHSGRLEWAQGVLNIGEALAVPVIRQLKEWAQPEDDQITILDSPPGSTCPMVETVAGSDFVILVTEPTPFGLHDLALAVDVLRELGLPGGVIINRDGIGDEGVDEYCASEGLPILLRIPFEREIASGIAQGRALVDLMPDYEEAFLQLYSTISTMKKQPGDSPATLPQAEMELQGAPGGGGR